MQKVESVKDEFQGRDYGIEKRLVIPSKSIEPKVKVILFPYRSGDVLPEFVISEDSFAVVKNRFVDIFSYRENKCGRTVVNMKRNGKGVF